MCGLSEVQRLSGVQHGLSAVQHGLSAIQHRLSVVHHGLSVVQHRLSVVQHRFSVVNHDIGVQAGGGKILQFSGKFWHIKVNFVQIYQKIAFFLAKQGSAPLEIFPQTPFMFGFSISPHAGSLRSSWGFPQSSVGFPQSSVGWLRSRASSGNPVQPLNRGQIGFHLSL